MHPLVTILFALVVFQTCLKVSNEQGAGELGKGEDTLSQLAPMAVDSIDKSHSDQLVIFKRDLQPILENRCQPCHFEGGKMHGRLPFDQEQTIHQLGEKIYSRIKDPGELDLFKQFHAQKSAEPVEE